MTATFASTEWAGQLASALEQSARVRTESVTWVFGPILLVAVADAEHDFAAAAIRLDVHEGSCRAVDATTPEAAARTPFVIEGSLDRWKSVLEGQLSIADAILDSKLLATGDLPSIVRHRGMFDAIAGAGGEVDTLWPQDQVAEPASA